MPSYVLVLEVGRPLTIKVGSLGTVSLEPGLYAYVGSGRRGLEARVRRHIRLKSGFGRIKWHIDYLLTSPDVKIFGAVLLRLMDEHEALEAVSKFSRPALKGFGSSDCRCYSHLFKLRSLEALEQLLGEPGAAFVKL